MCSRCSRRKRRSRTRRSSGWCSTPSPRRRSPRRCSTRAPSIRPWSMPIWRAAHSIIWSVSRCRRCCGASSRARVRRPRAVCRIAARRRSRTRNRKIRPPGILVAGGDACDTARRDLRGPACRRRRQKLQRLDIGSGAEADAFKQALETAAFAVNVCRGEAGQTASLSAVYDLDLAAGSKPQARLRSGAHDACGATALRRHRHRRRDCRPDHLYAHRRRADRR